MNIVNLCDCICGSSKGNYLAVPPDTKVLLHLLGFFLPCVVPCLHKPHLEEDLSVDVCLGTLIALLDQDRCLAFCL